jgi:hypothetical protein
MPGKRITRQQAKVYMTLRKSGLNQTICSAKAGFSSRSGRNIERKGVTAFTQKKESSKKHNDPLEGLWESVLVPLLEQTPYLTSWTLLEHLQDQYPGKYPDTLIRTIQRRISKWKALYGPEREIIFRQIHVPGRQGLSDFTCLKNIEITICGQLLKHILYHFRLAYSNWSFMKVIQGGESFTALSQGLQDALWSLGACPEEHRTDSLSAAFKNLSQDELKDITLSYDEVCSHYGMQATRNNRGKGHENGSVEAAHGHLKRRLEQALLLRGSYDFKSIEEYQDFIDIVVQKHNNRHQPQLYIERPYLKELPVQRTIDFSEATARVTTSSTISVKKVMYSVPSRLIGYQLKIHIYDGHLSCYLGNDHVLNLPRVRVDNNNKQEKARCINYRHLINSLVQKPGAFRGSMLRDDMLPTPIYKKIWELIDQYCTPRHANKLMVGILKLAADHNCEQQLGEFVLSSLTKAKIPCLGMLQKKYKPSMKLSPPTVGVTQHSLETYNNLLPSFMEVGHA